MESMGVSVETSGIKVDSERAYLVNLNADPSLNELLVSFRCLVFDSLMSCHFDV